ncbi:MAG: hypothetical protein IIY19_05100 [Lachnospiraceae bacterium]|nr:hypothetical protein [Lachnospiraceae bacterium]
MTSMYDKFENNTYEIKATAFTARGASFGFITRPLMHAPIVNQGKWGTITLHLTSGKGAAMAGDSYMQLVPVHHGEEIAYAIETTPTELLLHSAYGDIKCCFAEPALMMVQGENGLGIRFETILPMHGVIRKRGENAWERSAAIVSCYTFNAVKGKMDMDPKWELERLSTPYVRGEIFPAEDGAFLLSIEETEDCGYVRDSYPTYEEGLANVKADWESFYTKLPGAEDKNKEKAAFMLWSMIERPSGRLKRSILHSTFPKAAPMWKECLMTAALSGNLPIAKELLLGQLDQQAPNGQIPSFMDHLNYDALNAAPPLQGWALKQLMKTNDLKEAFSKEELQTLYESYAKWDAWFDEYRDDDKDGIVQTEGMIECGCEDSPVFAKYYIVELPEINAELALLEEAIGDLAGMLDLSEEKEKWYAKSKERIAKLLEKFWKGDRFVGFDHETKAVIDTQSIQFYRPLILGNRLPQEVIDKMAEDLSYANGFLTPRGFLSQHMGSKEYSRLSLEGGSINAWDQIMVTMGLAEAGKTEQAKEAAALYCDGLVNPVPTNYNCSAGFDSAETAAAYIVLKELA